MKTLLTRLKLLAVAGITTAMGLAALPVQAAEPSVQLGVVAQRYPWNGTLDVGYRANGLPAAGTNAVATVTANGKTICTQNVTLTNGQHTAALTLPADVKAKDARVTLTLK